MTDLENRAKARVLELKLIIDLVRSAVLASHGEQFSELDSSTRIDQVSARLNCSITNYSSYIEDIRQIIELATESSKKESINNDLLPEAAHVARLTFVNGDQIQINPDGRIPLDALMIVIYQEQIPIKNITKDAIELLQQGRRLKFILCTGSGKEYTDNHLTMLLAGRGYPAV
jgi:hypothetical protein